MRTNPNNTSINKHLPNPNNTPINYKLTRGCSRILIIPGFALNKHAHES